MFILKFIYRFTGNFIWKIFGGVAYSVIWFSIGVILSLTVIGFPLGVRCFKIGWLVWKPFGKGVVTNFLEYPVSNLVWSLTFGMILTVSALFSAILSAITLVGIPLMPQWFKIAKLSLLPFGAFIR